MKNGGFKILIVEIKKNQHLHKFYKNKRCCYFYLKIKNQTNSDLPSSFAYILSCCLVVNWKYISVFDTDL